MFSNKRKYNRGHVSGGQWLFWMVEQDTGRMLVFCIPDHQWETLVTWQEHESGDHFWQVVTIPYLERCKLHPPDGQSLGKLCWPLNWSIQQRHRGPLLSSKLKLKALNRTTKAKLPGYLDEFNWNKLHQEGNLGDRFHHMLSHIAEIFPLN